MEAVGSAVVVESSVSSRRKLWRAGCRRLVGKSVSYAVGLEIQELWVASTAIVLSRPRTSAIAEPKTWLRCSGRGYDGTRLPSQHQRPRPYAVAGLLRGHGSWAMVRSVGRNTQRRTVHRLCLGVAWQIHADVLAWARMLRPLCNARIRHIRSRYRRRSRGLYRGLRYAALAIGDTTCIGPPKLDVFRSAALFDPRLNLDLSHDAGPQARSLPCYPSQFPDSNEHPGRSAIRTTAP
ncbi:hypothetical protein FKP32DRAFT_1305787 [Trametes sanguinea]|nr:hypothetical protein FKP32DRAFT_1305787 [Trametes sanguinea]